MLSGATPSALAMVGTAVFRMVVSSDSMKKATATSHGNNRFTDSPEGDEGGNSVLELAGIILVPDSISGLHVFANDTAGADDHVLHPHPFVDLPEKTVPADGELKFVRVLAFAHSFRWFESITNHHLLYYQQSKGVCDFLKPAPKKS